MTPFLKWAGGKRWLTTEVYAHLFPDNESFNRYFEPFLGGAAVFFFLNPKNGGVLSDTNGDLINTYRTIKNHWRDLYQILERYHSQHNSDFYYTIRATQETDRLHQAARFVYLNRTCWNGLYRVNLAGQFNVPIGTKTDVIVDNDDFPGVSQRLQRFRLSRCDFEITIDQAVENDFLFVDPPYTVKHNLNGFIKYNEDLFSWADQVRLRNAVVRAVDRGVKVLVLNANHNSIRNLYKGIGRKYSLNRKSVIAADPAARGVYSELAIKCWE